MIFQSLCEIVDSPELGHVIVVKSDTERAHRTVRNDGWRHIDLLAEWLRRHPGTMVDGGANVGTFTLALAPIAEHVHAFEAQPLLAAALGGSVALNGLRNVSVHNVALDAEVGYLPVPAVDYNARGDFGRVEFGERTADPDIPMSQGNAGYVVAMQLDSYWLRDVSVIKLDVEGMEERALSGAAEVLRMHRPLLLVEWNKSNVDVLWRLVDRYGYDVEPSGSDWVCRPRR